MWGRVDRLLSVALTAAAVAIAVSVTFRTFFAADRSPERRPEYMRSWKTILRSGILLGGKADAPITLIEVADLECPACRAFHSTVQALLAEYSQLRVVFVHWPLDYHKHALPAARAAECAFQRGAFREWVEAVYAKQDSMGTKSWASYAREAGIRDTTAIEQCATDPRITARIADGISFAKQIEASGTPTVLLNGWRYRGTPSREQIKRGVDALLRGQRPK
jgi:protein-disulfide isomerase